MLRIRSAGSFRVAMDGVHRKRRQAHRDVFGAAVRRAVANPLARRGDHGLTRVDVDRAVFVFDPHRALEHDGDLLELRTLAGFLPSGRRHHSRHADRGMSRVHAAGVLLDPFGWRAGGLNDRRAVNKSWHELVTEP
jgi:hypothetical protein